MIRAVVFDIGETLTRDDRYWASWADWLGVPRHTVSALVGAVVTQGRDNAEALRIIRPDIDIAAEYAAREAAGQGEHLDETDLYPDVHLALEGLRKLGIRVIVAGNQTGKAGEMLRALDLPADLVATSAEWGVAKPDAEFFRRVLAASGAAPPTRPSTWAITRRTTSSLPRLQDCGPPTFAADRGDTGGPTTPTSLPPRTGRSLRSRT